MFKKEQLTSDTGVMKTKALFLEMSYHNKTSAIFTLKDEDYKGYKSLYCLYMEEGDITEYNFAMKVFGSWAHWKKLLDCGWFTPYIERWREELELKMKASALANIMDDAKDTLSKTKVSSNKYLLEKGWEPKDAKSKVGRPSKDAIKKEAKKLHQQQSDLEDDFNRLRLN